jgi:hypothetical protein
MECADDAPGGRRESPTRRFVTGRLHRALGAGHRARCRTQCGQLYAKGENEAGRAAVGPPAAPQLAAASKGCPGRSLKRAPAGRITATRRTSTWRRRGCASRSRSLVCCCALRNGTARGGRPASRSKTGQWRRAARKGVAGRTARLETLARRADLLGDATQPAGSPSQDTALLRASDLAAEARTALGGRELDSRRMRDVPGRPRRVHQCDRGRPKKADDEGEWEKALAGEIHDVLGLLN